MSKVIDCWNFPLFATTEAELHKLFAQFGTVEAITSLTDRNGNRKSACDIKMSDGADTAIRALHGHIFKGRRLMVTEVRYAVPRW